MKTRILIIGANGQLGTVLTHSLQQKYGVKHVIASDIVRKKSFKGLFEIIDATNFNALQSIVFKNKITQIYHLAAILSAKGEQDPLQTWELNMKTWLTVLEVARIHQIEKVFYPSSIAVFGASAKKNNTPNNAFLDPSTAYGISKAAGEQWANYYFTKYGLDVRSVRYPGIIGHQSLPGGGTTDYAISIFHKAVLKKPFICYLEKNTKLPMMYIQDAIRATIELMQAPSEKLNIRSSYNLAGISFAPEEIAASVKKHLPEFEMSYDPDFRQAIADSWPSSIDDGPARADWGWKHEYDLDRMTETMLRHLKEKLA